jgi:hypothetical protein
MLRSNISAGWTAIRRRPGIAFLLFFVHAVLAYAVAAPIGAALNSSFGDSGFVPEMTRATDLVLLLDFFELNPSLIPTVMALMLWMVPLLFLWSTASGVGVVHGLRDGAVRPFWAGVTEFFLRGLGLSALYLFCVAGWTLLVGLAAFVLTLAWPGEVGAFWDLFVLAPGVWVVGIAVIDLMQDYARIGLVARGLPVFESFLFGFSAPFRVRGAKRLYLFWLVPAILLTLAPSMAGAWLGAGTLVFLIQQLFLFGRAATTVGWIGSEVALWERLDIEATPALATNE